MQVSFTAFGTFVLASLGVLWPGASSARTPAPGGRPRAHLAPPDLPSRRKQADTSEKVLPAAFFPPTEPHSSRSTWKQSLRKYSGQGVGQLGQDMWLVPPGGRVGGAGRACGSTRPTWSGSSSTSQSRTPLWSQQLE